MTRLEQRGAVALTAMAATPPLNEKCAAFLGGVLTVFWFPKKGAGPPRALLYAQSPYLLRWRAIVAEALSSQLRLIRPSAG
jgi:hypothetical protein